MFGHSTPDEPLVCDLCKQEADTVFIINLSAIPGVTPASHVKEVCPECFLKLIPKGQ